MESSIGASALAAHSAPLHDDPFVSPPPFGTGGVMMARHQQASLDGLLDQGTTVFNHTNTIHYLDHLQNSNVRESNQKPPADGLPDDVPFQANTITNHSIETDGVELTNGLELATEDVSQDASQQELVRQLEDNMILNQAFQQRPILNDNLPDIQNARAFAKLVFPDGDYFITTHDVMLGRNMEYFNQVKREQRAAKSAREALVHYAQEPSQPSQPGEEQAPANESTSGASLEGRPAPPSNFSEHGGAVAYVDDQADLRGRRRHRKSLQFSKTPSTTSVAPASLHTSMMAHSETGFDSDGEPVFRTFAQIPIHTQIPEDIVKISKEHLMFSYNFPEEIWELKIAGNRAFVNDQLFERDDVVPLEHNDEIMVASLHITFKLPDNFRRSPGLSRGTFSVYDDDDGLEGSDAGGRGASTSPVRRLSNAFEGTEREGGKPKPTIKLKLGIKDKTKAKGTDLEKPIEKAPKEAKPTAKVKVSPGGASPEESRKADKGGKTPALPAKQPGEAAKPSQVSPATAPPHIEPGSALEHVPTDELPQKRKGPGRPPKNGFVSKRDLALVKRKQKEYEKSGKEAPTFDSLVDEVRRENKAREMQAKLAQSGQPMPPDMPVVQSIETDASGAMPTAPKPPTIPTGEATDQTSATPAEPVRKPSPKPKRTARSPSPMKPESAYTEEELRKPNGTYVHILDEVLRDHPTGRADLQEIYDRIMKRYPFYKYRVTTTGWQSSVRHNLLQNERFKENGRSGKGKLWAINPDVPLEKEKKKRATPPRQMPMVNGHYMGGLPATQYGQQGYGNPYGHPQQAGQTQFNASGQSGGGAYFSPYAQPGFAGGQGQHPPGAHVPGRQHPLPPQQSNGGQQPGQQPGQSQPKATGFQGLVNEIMRYRGVYLGQFIPGSQQYTAHESIFVRCTNHLSDLFHTGKKGTDIMPTLQDEEEKKVFGALDALFRNHYQGQDVKQEEAKGPTAGVERNQTVGEAVESGAAAARAADQETKSVSQSQDGASNPTAPQTQSTGLPAVSQPASTVHSASPMVPRHVPTMSSADPSVANLPAAGPGPPTTAPLLGTSASSNSETAIVAQQNGLSQNASTTSANAAAPAVMQPPPPRIPTPNAPPRQDVAPVATTAPSPTVPPSAPPASHSAPSPGPQSSALPAAAAAPPPPSTSTLATPSPFTGTKRPADDDAGNEEMPDSKRTKGSEGVTDQAQPPQNL